MVRARKYVVKNYFKGIPKREDYEIVEYDLPPLEDGEVLVKSEWLSVDPYLRAINSRYSIPYDQFGFQVGIVQQSRNSKFPPGTKVVTHNGWCDFSIAKEVIGFGSVGQLYEIPDLKGLSTSLGVGAVGMPGATAYFGFLEICKPKAGEAVVVTGAAGAVGSLVGQIAKIKGCKVIGFAGSDDKVKWLEKELGFDKAINYKTADVCKALKEAAPNGVDCYLDNVGGEISNIIMNQMNKFGRVSVCGSISSYNDDEIKMPVAIPSLSNNQITVRKFIAGEWYDRWEEGFSQLVEWIKSGQVKTREHVTEGFENIFEAFVGMLAGDNFGKAVVKI